MSKQCATCRIRKRRRATEHDIDRGAGRVAVRRFDPTRDSYEKLTTMLHRAFAQLGMMGLNCTCVAQSADVTRQRAQAGECFVASVRGQVIGTVTLYARDDASECKLPVHEELIYDPPGKFYSSNRSGISVNEKLSFVAARALRRASIGGIALPAIRLGGADALRLDRKRHAVQSDAGRSRRNMDYRFYR